MDFQRIWQKKKNWILQKKKDFQRIGKRKKDSFFKYKWCILFILSILYCVLYRYSFWYDLLQTIGLFVTLAGLPAIFIGIIGVNKNIRTYKAFRLIDLDLKQTMLNEQQKRLEETYNSLAKEKKNEKEIEAIRREIGTISTRLSENQKMIDILSEQAESK